MNELIGRYPFVVEPFSEDFMGRLSWGFLGNHLLRCASRHAGSFGFGMENVKQNNQAWVLARLVVELDHMPCLGQSYTIETWVSKIYRQFTDRLFAIVDDQQQPYGYAQSVWALIDYDTRLPIDFTTFGNSAFLGAVVDRTVPIQGPGRVRVKSAEPERQLTASYSDLDINGHVNSIRYIQMILDLFQKELYIQRKVVKRMEMTYCAESYCGETLSFYKENLGEGKYAVDIKNEKGIAVKALVMIEE